MIPAIVLHCGNADTPPLTEEKPVPHEIAGTYTLKPSGNLRRIIIRPDGTLILKKNDRGLTQSGLVSMQGKLIRFRGPDSKIIGVFSVEAYSQSKAGWRGMWQNHTARLYYESDSLKESF